MATTIEEFKQAFAEALTGDEFTRRDEQVAATLKRLNRSVDALGPACPESRRFRGDLQALVQRYRDARQTNGRPASQVAAELEQIHRAADTAFRTVAGASTRMGGHAAPAVSNPRATPAGASARTEGDSAAIKSNPRTVAANDQNRNGQAAVPSNPARPPVAAGTRAAVGPSDSAPPPVVAGRDGTRDVSGPVDLLTSRDREVAESLRALLQSVEALGPDSPAYQPSREALVGLTRRYRDAREANRRPPSETVAELFTIHRAVADAIRELAGGPTSMKGNRSPSDAGAKAEATDVPAAHPSAVPDLDVGSHRPEERAPAAKQPASSNTDQPVADTACGTRITLEFNVQASGQFVEHATIRISNQSRVTNARGMAEFALEPGVYEYHVSAAGYDELRGNVEVAATADRERHGVVLHPLNAARSDVLVRVLDAQTRRPIERAFVRFANDVDLTDANGEVRFIGVPSGSDPYLYEVQAEGYESQSDSYFHEDEQGSVLTVDLAPLGAPPTAPASPPAPDADAAPATDGDADDETAAPPTADTGGPLQPTDGAVPDADATPDAASAGGDGGAAQHTSQVLRRGARGPAVSFLQEQLNQEGAGLQVDGIFGPRTQRAVTEFQRSHGLDVDGVVGPQTWQALTGVSTGGTNDPADSPPRQPPRDRTVQTSMAVVNNIDYDAFRHSVVDWIGQFVVRQRADALVDASNLRAQFATLHETMRRLPADGTTTFQIAARLVAGSARYEAVEFSVHDVNTSESVERPTTEGRDIEEGGMCVDGTCVDPPADDEADAQGDQSSRAPLRDRTIETRIEVPDDYAGFHSSVVAWIRRFVVSDRADGLVASSNLRELHARLAAAETAQVRLAAHLRAGRSRYERIDFSTPGLTVLEPTEIVGDPTIQQQIDDRLRRREEFVQQFRRQVARAHDVTQHAVMEGSTRYREDEFSRRYREFMTILQGITLVLESGSDPSSLRADRLVQMQVVRELERVAEQEIARADELADRIRQHDEELRALHRRLGQTFNPDEVSTPDFHR